jgi:hypothetical protein
MKKMNQMLFGAAVLTMVTLTNACKKTSDPGPAGTNGTNAVELKYKQSGTTLRLSGNYSSDGTAFDSTYKLSYFASLDDNSIVEETILDQNDASVTSHFYHIVRHDSLNNSVLSFDIAFYGGDETPTVENLTIDIVSGITSAGYKRIATGQVNNPSISSYHDANGYFTKGPLGQYDVSNSDNTLQISNWSYNNTTRNLSFNFSGVLVDYLNSTKKPLTISANVTANLNQETHRVGKE